jgi:hypothetical protein
MAGAPEVSRAKKTWSKNFVYCMMSFARCARGSSGTDMMAYEVPNMRERYEAQSGWSSVESEDPAAFGPLSTATGRSPISGHRFRVSRMSLPFSSELTTTAGIPHHDRRAKRMRVSPRAMGKAIVPVSPAVATRRAVCPSPVARNTVRTAVPVITPVRVARRCISSAG